MLLLSLRVCSLVCVCAHVFILFICLFVCLFVSSFVYHSWCSARTSGYGQIRREKKKKKKKKKKLQSVCFCLSLSFISIFQIIVWCTCFERKQNSTIVINTLKFSFPRSVTILRCSHLLLYGSFAFLLPWALFIIPFLCALCDTFVIHLLYVLLFFCERKIYLNYLISCLMLNNLESVI